MNDPLDAWADRGTPRGAREVLRAARQQARHRRTRQRQALTAAVVLVVALSVGGTVALMGERPDSVESGPAETGPEGSAPATDPPPGPTSAPGGSDDGRVAVGVHFLSEEAAAADGTCTETVRVERQVPGPDVLRAALEALVAGPTDSERTEHGLVDFFSADTAGTLAAVALADGVARVDFAGLDAAIPGASASCGSAALLAQLDRTVLQFPSVDRVLYSLDGDVDAFYHWLQMDRPEWARALAPVDLDDLRVSCGGPSYRPTAFDAPIGAEQADDPAAAALRALIADPDGIGPIPGSGWRRLHDGGGTVVFGHGTPDEPGGLVEVTFEDDGTGFSYSGSSHGCRPTVDVGGWSLARFALPEGLVVPPDATSVEVLVTERACTGATPLGDRLQEPLVRYGEGFIDVLFVAEPLEGDAFTCPGNPAQRVRVELDQRLGDRSIRDLSTYPPRDPSEPDG